MKSNSDSIPMSLNFTSVISAKDFPNAFLPLPSETILESLLQKARCCFLYSDGSGRLLQDSSDTSKTLGRDDVSQKPARPLESPSSLHANVEIFCMIRSWLILHQPPQLIDSRDDIDARISQVSNSIQLMASALLLHRCWLHLIEEEASQTVSTSPQFLKISSGTRNIVSDVIMAIHETLPSLIHNSPQDHNYKDADGEPFNKKRRRRRQALLELSSIEWLDPHLVDWNLCRAMDQFIFLCSGETQPVRVDQIDKTKSECYNRYQHFVRTFRRFSLNEKRKLKIDEDDATREVNVGNVTFSLVQLLKEIRMVMQQSIEAYNDFRTIFRAVFDSPESLSSVPLQQRMSLIVKFSPSLTLGSNTSSHLINQQQKLLLELGWRLSLHARLTLPQQPLSTATHTDYCRAHSMFCSAASITCIATLLLDGFVRVDSEKYFEPTTDVLSSSFTLDFVFDMIMTVKNAVDFVCPHCIVSTETQSSHEENVVPNGIASTSDVHAAACTLLQSILSAAERSDASSSIYNGTVHLQLQALDETSKKTIVNSFASTVCALSDLSICKASTVPYYYYINQTAIPVNCFADALGCSNMDWFKIKSCNAFDDNNNILPAEAHPTSSLNVCDVDNPVHASSSLFIDKLSRATAVLATIEEVERHTHQCYAIPVVISDHMELTEWAVSTCFVKDVHPSTNLLALLEEYAETCVGARSCWQDVIYPVLNKTLRRLSQECDKQENTDEAPVSVIPTGSNAGYVRMLIEVSADMQLWKAMVALYYHSLEAILYCDKVKSTKNAKLIMTRTVLLESFHQSLMACCCVCLTKANAFAQRLHVSFFMKHLPIMSILFITGSGPFEFLKVSHRFLESLSVASVARGKLGSPLIFHLPALLRKDIEQIEVNTIDSLLWLRNKALPSGTSFTDKILQYHKSADSVPCLWPPHVLAPKLQEELEDAGIATYIAPTYPTLDHPEFDDLCAVLLVVKKLLLLAHNRLVALCKFLQVHDQCPLFKQVWVTFRHLLRNHVELFFDRHIDQWMLCTLYGVSRSVRYQPELKFAKIIEAYVAIREHELGSIMCQRIVRHIRITAPTSTDEGMGNIISLYNKVFVPRMKEYLLNSESLRRCTIKLASSQQSKTDH